MTVILTSKIDLYDKDKLGNKIPKKIKNINHILDNIKKNITKYDNFLYIASDETNTNVTDIYANATFESFDMTIPFKKYNILDIRTENYAKKLIEEADLIFLCGGHLPTQNKFFNKINLKEVIKKSKALIIGVSAGSMNSAINVYSIPELKGESIDPNFEKNLPGLGLTNINILPHYSDFLDYSIDNKDFIREIIIPESYNRKIYAINDDSYFIVEKNHTHLYGEAFIIENGIIKKIIQTDIS